MVFSKEEKEIWAKSEVMREFERIAQGGGLDTPEEAFLPLDKDWESERSDEEKLMDAINEFEQEDKLIEQQREREVPVNEEKIMPIPEHEKELSSAFVDSDLDPADEDYLEQKDKVEKEKNMRQFEEGESRPWNWRPTIEHSQIEAAELISGLAKLASYIGKQGKVIAACRIEDTIKDIRIALREAKNG